MTLQELINASGRLIGELRGDRSFGVVESGNFLVSMNQMLASWSEAGFGVFQITRELLPSTGAASYTIGPSGTLVTSRPVSIDSAAVLASSGVQLPIPTIATAADWSQIVDDSATGDFAEMLFPDYGFPNITIRTWPKINSGSTLIMYNLKPLTAFSTLSDTVAFPPGYEEALIHAFAVRIAPEFGKQAPDSVIAMADRGIQAIKMANAQLMPSPPAPVEVSAQ